VSNACIVGAVASGSREVLVEGAPQPDACAIDISTGANGLADGCWGGVAEFFERHRLGGIRISINDAGATPAIVSLRLDQAIEEFTRRDPT